MYKSYLRRRYKKKNFRRKISWKIKNDQKLFYA